MTVKPDFREIDKLFADYDKPDAPGCAIAIIHEGEMIYKRGYGLANLEHAIPNTPSIVFDIGSVSKQFTATCALLLEYQHKLSLDDDITKYLPELKYNHKITLRHLIHHTSGIPDYLELMSLAGLPFYNDYPEAQIIELIAGQPLIFAPGQHHLYSNSGYFLLAEIIARVSGQSLNDFATEHIFRPLGMSSTQFYDDHTRIIKNRATGYTPTDNGFAIEQYKLDVVGDGAVHTSVEDLFLWDQNFYDNILVGGQEFIEAMLTTGKLNSGKDTGYAFGLYINIYGDQPCVFHNGGWAGYTSEFARLSAQKFSFIMLNNRPDTDFLYASRIVKLCLADVFGTQESSDEEKPEENVQTAFEISAKEPEIYAGDYSNEDLHVTHTYAVKDGRLELYFPYQKEGLKLTAISPDQFQAYDGYLEFTFERNNEKTTGVSVKSGRLKPILFTKKS
jgi:CubicO group peptidase (beta-lactamase class C family)